MEKKIILIVLMLNPLPDKPEITQNGNTLTSSGADAYQWLKDGKKIQGATNQSYTATKSGKYRVNVYNSSNCRSTSDVVIINISSIQEVGKRICSIYPNPSIGNFTVRVLNGIDETDIRIFDVNGKLVAEKHLNGNESYQMNLAHLPKGVYKLQARTNSMTVYQTLIIF